MCKLFHLNTENVNIAFETFFFQLRSKVKMRIHESAKVYRVSQFRAW